MRSAPVFLLCLVFAACAAPEPLVVPDSTAVTEVPAPEPELRPVPPPEPPPPPPPPAEAPRGSIEGRSVYPEPGIVEWRLANGMTVIYKRLAESDATGIAYAEGYAPGGFQALSGDGEEASRLALAIASARWGAVTSSLGAYERRIEGRGIGLRALLADVAAVFTEVPSLTDPRAWRDPLDGPWDDPGPSPSASEISDAAREVFARPETFTLVVVGEASDDDAEALVGTILGPLRARRGRIENAVATSSSGPGIWMAEGGGAPVVQSLRVRADINEAPALAVLAAVVAERLGGPRVTHRLDPLRETAEITIRSGEPVDLGVLDRPLTEAEVAQARRQSRATDADFARADVWLDVIERHYREDGPYRPARSPREIGELARQIDAVSMQRVNVLLARFRETPTRATLTAP